ncbi:MAG: DUF2914 domain-containing protein [Gemmatimonadota bacterium]
MRKVSGFFGLAVSFILLLCLASPVAAQQSQVEAEIVIAHEVVDREPVEPADTFPADVGEVAAWTRITAAAGTTIEHVWRYQGEAWEVPLQVDGSPWRTWSTKVIPREWEGEWTFDVEDADGNVVASETFFVGSPPFDAR